jgi:chemotaxis protein methyltransferase CheR
MNPETYALVKRSVRTLLDIDLTPYKDEQMKRRLDSWLVRAGAPSWNVYASRLRDDQTELSRFRDYLTINVSAFFRDPERWRYLRDVILAELRAERAAGGMAAPLRVWSAGCSIGPEPYSLAMLFDEMIPSPRHAILATDLDRGALAKARARGPYTADDVHNLTPAQRQRYLEPGGPPYTLRPSLSRHIEFREHNMLEDPFERGFDLIVCRNVVIYFTQDAKTVLYQRFQQALRPGGILFVGGTEVIPRPNEVGLESHGISFYRRR